MVSYRSGAEPLADYKAKSMETKPENSTPPFKLLILDLFDAFHYADVVEGDWRYAWLTGGPWPMTRLEGVIGYADRLFWARKPNAKTQYQWCELDAGYDVRIYDAENRCVYKAHEKLPEK